MCVPSNIARKPHWQAGFLFCGFRTLMPYCITMCVPCNIAMCVREQVLTINQVFDILVEVNSGRGWAKALKNNVPPKTGFVIKEEKDGDQIIIEEGVQKQHDQDGKEDQGNQGELTNTLRHNGQPEMMDAVIKKQGCD